MKLCISPVICSYFGNAHIPALSHQIGSLNMLHNGLLKNNLSFRLSVKLNKKKFL